MNRIVSTPMLQITATPLGKRDRMARVPQTGIRNIARYASA